jgi:ubiquinone/menaquinone biosynthesis C-methylase UbiE
MEKREAPTDYWKTWWNEQARNSVSDFALNRMTSLRLARLEQRELNNFIRAVDPQPNDVVLDAGCGSGRNISILSSRVRRIVGIDYSEEMIRRAVERAEGEKLSNVNVLQGDVTSLSFPPNTFDKVICASVLQYLNDTDCALALREMVRVCKPGGTLLLHIKNGTSLYGLSLKILRPLCRILGRQMKPEYYRSRGWHVRTLRAESSTITDYDGFGILTFVPLPQWIVGFLLQCEIYLPVPKRMKNFAVNYKLTARINKSASSAC